MTDKEIRDLLDKYSFRATAGRRTDGSPVYYAWYDELPGIVAESGSRDGARAELDAIAPAILGKLSAEGVTLPAPFSTRDPRTLTQTIQLDGLVVGGNISPAEVATADLAHPPKVIRGKMVAA